MSSLSELSGAVSGLSGICNTLQNSYTYINQQLLRTTDLNSFSQYQVIWNSQVQSVAEDVAVLQRQVSVLQNMLINLNINVANNLASFLIHTGRTATLGHLGLV